MWFLSSYLVLFLALRLSTCDDSPTVLDDFPNPPLSTTSASSVATDKGPPNKETSGPCNRNRTLGKKHDPWAMYERVRNMSVALVQKQSKTFFERVLDRVELVLNCRREVRQRLETALALCQSAEQVAQKDVEDAKRKALERKANPVSIDKKKLNAEIAERKNRLTAAEDILRKAEISIEALLPNQTDKMEHIAQILNNKTILDDAIKNVTAKIEKIESEKLKLTSILSEKQEVITTGTSIYKDKCLDENASGCAVRKTKLEQKKKEAQKITSALGKIEGEIAQAKSAQYSLETTFNSLQALHAKFVHFLDATDNRTAAVDDLREAEERAKMKSEVAKADNAVKYLETDLDDARRDVATAQKPLTAVAEEIHSMEEKVETMRKELQKFRNKTKPVSVEDKYIAPVGAGLFCLVGLIGTYRFYLDVLEALNEGKNSKAVMKNVKKIPYAVKIVKETEKEVASRSSLSSNAAAELSSRNDEHRDSHFSSSNSHFVNTTTQRRFTEDP